MRTAKRPLPASGIMAGHPDTSITRQVVNEDIRLFAPLLSTKLHLPRRHRLSQQATLVARPRLPARLEAGMGGKLTLIAAPAGFGKSTLLYEWIDEVEGALPESGPDSGAKSADRTGARQASPRTVCWLALEESDNDPIRFWLYFMAALHTKHPDLGRNLPILLQSAEPPPLETILILLINDLIAAADPDAPATSAEIVLVLEDYHFIAIPAIHQSLAFLLDHLPPMLHIVMTTRADPPLPLARLRARGQLLEIRADELRFTPEETAIFLNQRMGLDLAPNEAQMLAERTEGWIAGIQLAALSMGSLADRSAFLAAFSGSHRYVFNYLIEEVLNQQPRSVQDFLNRTCILTRLSGPLCDAMIASWTEGGVEMASLSPSVNSQVMLEQLERANLFLVPLDDGGQWYRYHQLFAEVLQYRLHQSQPELPAILHRRASRWFAEQGYSADAIRHALLAADFAAAAGWIEDVWSTLWDEGAAATLFGWMEALPATTLAERPSLYVAYAWSLALSGQIEAAESTLHRVDLFLQRTPSESAAAPRHRILLGRVAALRAMLAARRGDPRSALTLAQQAIALIPREAPARGDAFYTLGLAQQQDGALTDALAAYATAVQVGEAANHRFLTAAARYHAARILTAQGWLQRAATAYQQILTMAAQSGKQLPVVGLAKIGYGEILYQWNDLAAALDRVERGVAQNPRRDLTYTDGPLHRFSILARIRQAVGDGEGALAAVNVAKETAQQTGIAVDAERAAALEALIQLRLGAQPPAVRWAARYARTYTVAERLLYRREFESQTYLRILLAQGRARDVLALVTQWLPAVQATQRHGTLLELSAVQLLALRLDGQTDQAMHLLARTLTRAEPEGYVRLFVEEGEPMRLALREFGAWLPVQPAPAAEVDLAAYANRLLTAFAGAEADASVLGAPAQLQPRQATPSQLIDPLTNREVEVLRLVTAGLSNAEIAAQLIVTVGTVKSHLKHIYSKLAVKSRTQAVAQARTLGLLHDDRSRF